MAAPAEIALSPLAQRLVAWGFLTQEEAAEAQAEANARNLPLLQLLVQKEKVSPGEVAAKLAEAFRLPFIDLRAIDWEKIPLEALSKQVLKKHRVLPILKQGRKLLLATSDPTRQETIDTLRFASPYELHFAVVEENKLAQAINFLLFTADEMLKKVIARQEESPSEEEAVTEVNIIDLEGGQTDEEILAEDKPIIHFVHTTLLEAIQRGASDIHFEPYEKELRVRFRCDGVLHEITRLPKSLTARIITRLKVMSGLDIAERRKPQDGRIKAKGEGKIVDLRVSTCPTLFGEKVVLRILESSPELLDVSKLGMDEVQRQAFLHAVRQPYGMILVTGPTGSGKTVTLYTALRLINTPDRNILTVEDPVEISLEGINQVNVNPKAGLTFAAALRAFLRQDPDVIMVGEIRDHETADIAVKAAQTGHLVLSTLHTNDAPQALIRLGQMGIAPYHVASSLLLIIAQRLVRKLCPECKRPGRYPPDYLRKMGFSPEEVSNLKLYSHNPRGCDFCLRGYRGRTAIFQVMPLSERLQELVLRGATVLEIERQARAEGVKTMLESGLDKVRAGITSLEEVNRVITIES